MVKTEWSYEALQYEYWVILKKLRYWEKLLTISSEKSMGFSALRLQDDMNVENSCCLRCRNI